MSHFASGQWNNPCGLVAQVDAAAVAAKTSSGAGATEGSNLLTYAPARSGMYRVSAYLRTQTASTANTSHTVVVNASYSNGTAVSTVALVPVNTTASTNLNQKTGTGTYYAAHAIIYAVTGTNIVMNTVDTVSGTGSGTYDVKFTIEAI